MIKNHKEFYKQYVDWFEIGHNGSPFPYPSIMVYLLDGELPRYEETWLPKEQDFIDNLKKEFLYKEKIEEIL